MTDGREHEKECLLSAERIERLRREHVERPLPRRFYVDVAVEEADGGFTVLLDGRPLRTPLKRPFTLPTRALAEAAAEEWRAQGEKIDPATMPMTGLANAAIDKAAGEERPALQEHLAELAEHDLLCYRAGPAQAGLAERQRARWDPLLRWAEEALGARLHLAEGIMPVAQPPESVAALLRPYQRADAFTFVPLFAMATLTRSVVIPLAVADGVLAPEQAWEAAALEERWNMELWGEDHEAALRLAARRDEFRAAARFLSLLRR